MAKHPTVTMVIVPEGGLILCYVFASRDTKLAVVTCPWRRIRNQAKDRTAVYHLMESLAVGSFILNRSQSLQAQDLCTHNSDTQTPSPHPFIPRQNHPPPHPSAPDPVPPTPSSSPSQHPSSSPPRSQSHHTPFPCEPLPAPT